MITISSCINIMVQLAILILGACSAILIICMLTRPLIKLTNSSIAISIIDSIIMISGIILAANLLCIVACYAIGNWILGYGTFIK